MAIGTPELIEKILFLCSVSANNINLDGCLLGDKTGQSSFADSGCGTDKHSIPRCIFGRESRVGSFDL
jgi:hypothetical protein